MKKIAFLLGLLFFTIGLFVLPHYGPNWDEPLHFSRGQAIFHYFLTGKKDYKDLKPYVKYTQKDDTILFSPVGVNKNNIPLRSVYEDNQENYTYFLKDYGHPPLSDIFSAFFNVVLFQDLRLVNDVDSYHIYSLLLGAILAGVVFWWTSKYYGGFAGFIASLSLSLYPLFLGESHFNIKDVPEAVFYSLTLIFFYEGFTRKKIWLIVSSSIFLAFAFSTKFNALFIPFTVIPWILVFLIHIKKEIKKYLKFSTSLLFYPVLTFAIFFSTWPFLWAAPIKGFLEVVKYYKDIGTNTAFDNRYLTIFKINTYAVKWILYTTPLVILLLFILGIIYFIVNLKKDKRKISLFVVLWFSLPILRVSAPDAGIYGGVRQIMEYVPAMAILAGIGAFFLREKIEKASAKFFNGKKYRMILGTLIVLSFLPISIKLISIHPNEDVYFNQLIGGLKGAADRKIPEWGQNLGNVNKQGIVWLNRNASPNPTLTTNFGLGSSVPALFLRSDIQFSNSFRSALERKGEYIIGITSDTGFEDTFLFKYLNKFLAPLYQVKVDNASLLTIWKNDRVNTKDGYKDLIPVPKNNIKATENQNIINISLSKVYNLAEMNVVFNNNRCEKEQNGEGSVQISSDGKNWETMDGDLKVQAFLAKTTYRGDNEFVYYFAAEKASLIKLNLTRQNSCFYHIENINVYYVSAK